MIWSGFRPSDDAQVYGYNTAVNMYVFGALVRAMKLNDVYWRQPRFAKLARDLCGTIKCAASGRSYGCSAWYSMKHSMNVSSDMTDAGQLPYSCIYATKVSCCSSTIS